MIYIYLAKYQRLVGYFVIALVMSLIVFNCTVYFYIDVLIGKNKTVI